MTTAAFHVEPMNLLSFTVHLLLSMGIATQVCAETERSNDSACAMLTQHAGISRSFIGVVMIRPTDDAIETAHASRHHHSPLLTFRKGSDLPNQARKACFNGELRQRLQGNLRGA